LGPPRSLSVWRHFSGTVCLMCSDVLTVVTICVTNCYMRTIMNISLPASLADEVRAEVAENGYASVSEFIRKLVRDWKKAKAINDVLESEKEFRQGKGKVLRSLADLR